MTFRLSDTYDEYLPPSRQQDWTGHFNNWNYLYYQTDESLLPCYSIKYITFNIYKEKNKIGFNKKQNINKKNS